VRIYIDSNKLKAACCFLPPFEVYAWFGLVNKINEVMFALT